MSHEEEEWWNMWEKKNVQLICDQFSSHSLHISLTSRAVYQQSELRGSFSSQLGQKHLVLPTLLQTKTAQLQSFMKFYDQLMKRCFTFNVCWPINATVSALMWIFFTGRAAESSDCGPLLWNVSLHSDVCSRYTLMLKRVSGVSRSSEF